MLEAILGTAKDYIENAVIKNKEIPKELNVVVSEVIFNTVSKSLKAQMGDSNSGFNISQLGRGNNNSFVDGMTESVVDALVKKTRMKSGIAQNVAAAILPGLIKTVLAKKVSGGNSPLGNIAGDLLGSMFKK